MRCEWRATSAPSGEEDDAARFRCADEDSRYPAATRVLQLKGLGALTYYYPEDHDPPRGIVFLFL